jgi:cell division protein FtsI/penicillin-binding protein 2
LEDEMRGDAPAVTERQDMRRTRRRQIFICAIICVVLVGLVGRLFYWQIVDRSFLAARAASEHLGQFTITARRGTIYDAQGNILALNLSGDAIYLQLANLQQIAVHQPQFLPTLAVQLAQVTGLSADLVLGELHSSQPGGYLLDAAGNRVHLTSDQEQQFNNLAGNTDYSGLVDFVPDTWRTYPNGDLAAQVLGYVDLNGAGHYGVEQEYNGLLGGRDGLMTTEMDENGQPLPFGTKTYTPPVNGADLTLTIDANIQRLAEQGLQATVKEYGAQSGSVIIVNVHTGAIVAMASTPTFNPNDYGLAAAQDGYQIFQNPVISTVYDPGSTMKAVTMSTGLNLGVIQPETSFYDPGYFDVPDTSLQIHNWNDAAYGQETMVGVLRHSANVGASWVAVTRIGMQRFDASLQRFGFGQRTGIDLPGESPGLLSSEHDLLTLADNSFGESIGVTPLQQVMVYAALANGGVLMQPYIVQQIDRNGQITRHHPVVVRRVVSAPAARELGQMLMQAAINGEAQETQVPGYEVATKTGTSTPDPNNPQATIASVAGFAPASNPQFAMLVKIDYPSWGVFGGTVAAPLWHDLAERLFFYYHIPPDVPSQLTNQP